jgi:hypothetical protein
VTMMMVTVVPGRDHNSLDVRSVGISPSIEFHILAAVQIKNFVLHQLAAL